MKNILQVVVVCMMLTLVASLGFAHGLKEPEHPPDCWLQPSGSDLWYPCDSEELKMVECLNLMELAMKALDPFVPSLAEMNAHPILNDKERGLRALKAWDRAKKSCWSDLKDLQSKHRH